MLLSRFLAAPSMPPSVLPSPAAAPPSYVRSPRRSGVSRSSITRASTRSFSASRSSSRVWAPTRFLKTGVPGMKYPCQLCSRSPVSQARPAPLLDVVPAAHALTQLCCRDVPARVCNLVGTRGGGAARALQLCALADRPYGLDPAL